MKARFNHTVSPHECKYDDGICRRCRKLEAEITSQDLLVAYTNKLEATIAELEAARREVIEIYAGMEGFVRVDENFWPIQPETAQEGYCLRIIEQMYKAALLEKDDE